MTISFIKDPQAIDWYYAVWCTKADGTNDGSSSDTGELQGATISSSSWTLPSGITKVTDNTNAVTYHGVTYGVDTVAAIKLSGGTAGTSYTIVNQITTSDGRTLDHAITIIVRDNVT